MQSKEYTAVAVTAEKWIRTEQVSVESLSIWLQMMKSERGYALVGLEQTKESVSITGFKFPRKCVLLLGNELRGMPAPLISILDHVVEIPQRGTIRSLNVHVSASIMISQYAMQQP
jgi:tRNA guanosine-2'-O-methyltransferase